MSHSFVNQLLLLRFQYQTSSPAIWPARRENPPRRSRGLSKKRNAAKILPAKDAKGREI
jgi:hypothetical protein